MTDYTVPRVTRRLLDDRPAAGAAGAAAVFPARQRSAAHRHLAAVARPRLGGLLLAWGLFQLFAGAQPDGAKVGGLVTGNLLTVATLLPALLKLQTSLPPSLRLVLWVVVGWLGLAALLALFAAPLGGRGGEAGVR